MRQSKSTTKRPYNARVDRDLLRLLKADESTQRRCRRSLASSRGEADAYSTLGCRRHNCYGEPLRTLITFPAVRGDHAGRDVPSVPAIARKWKAPSYARSLNEYDESLTPHLVIVSIQRLQEPTCLV